MEKNQNKTCKKHSCYAQSALIFFSILLLSYVDYIVLEKIYHPIAAKHNINWDAEFNAVIFGRQTPILRWQLAFMPLGVVLFILLGIAARSFRLAFSGILLFATGWEDIFYYLIQGKWLPAELGWLDYSPLMGLTRHISATEHVTSTGIIVSSTVGLFIAGIVLFGSEYKMKRDTA
ncbi:MAG: hypothetical protein ABFD91_04245 [Anaerohalosphaeraceae bacterium]